MANVLGRRFKSIEGAVRRVKELEQQLVASERVARRLTEEKAELIKQRRALAKLAAKGPTFYSPLEVAAVETLRDQILANECNMKPDGSPLS